MLQVPTQTTITPILIFEYNNSLPAVSVLIIGRSLFVVVDIQSVCMVWSGGILN